MPFLTLDMVELTLSLPESYLISPQGETKHVFRSAMRGIVPDDILARRDKIGFATPESGWILEAAGSVRNWISEGLDVPFIDKKVQMKMFDEVVSGRMGYSPQIWRWLNFSRWHSIYFEN